MQCPQSDLKIIHEYKRDEIVYSARQGSEFGLEKTLWNKKKERNMK